MSGPDCAKPVVLVMGPAGSGKSRLGEALATELGAHFIEADVHHPPENIDRMRRGIALTDEDRAGWLAALASELLNTASLGRPRVLACSALKRAYRDRLRAACADLALVYIEAPRALLADRMARRRGHFMAPALLESQLATLERPTEDERPIQVDARWPTERQVATVLAALSCFQTDAVSPPST